MMPDRPSNHWLITGASGLLGHYLCRYLAGNGHAVTAVCNEHEVSVRGVDTVRLDLSQSGLLAQLIQRSQPDVVLHAAGITNVDACEANEDIAYQLHSQIAGEMAQAARAAGARPILISTDHLWDGSKRFVSEETPVAPVNAYARTKAAGEVLALAGDPATLVIRTNFFGIGPSWRNGLTDWFINKFSKGQEIPAFVDVHFTPIALGLMCPIIERLAELNAQGIYNLAGSERVSKYEFALKLAAQLGFNEKLVCASSISDVFLEATRPNDMSLATDKAADLLGRRLPRLQESLETLRLTFDESKKSIGSR